MIRDCRIGYRNFGKLNADKPNAILFQMWFSAERIAEAAKRRWAKFRAIGKKK